MVSADVEIHNSSDERNDSTDELKKTNEDAWLLGVGLIDDLVLLGLLDHEDDGLLPSLVRHDSLPIVN